MNPNPPVSADDVSDPVDYSAVFSRHPLPMWVYHRQTLRLLAVNDAALAAYGYTREEMLALTIRDIRPPEDIPQLERTIAHDLERTTQVSHAWRHRRRDGVVFDVEVTSFAIEFAGMPARLVLAQDVSERHRVERALRESESKYRLLTEQASDAIFVADGAGRLLSANPQARLLLGYDEAELLGLRYDDLLTPEELAAHPPRLADLRAGATVLRERMFRRKDGRAVPVEVSTRLLEDGRLHSIVRDISVRKRAEEALRQSEQHYRSLVQNAPYGIYRSAVDGGFLAVNPALVDMLGYASEDELLAADVASDIYADPGERGRLIETYRRRLTIDEVEVQWKRKDGSPIIVRLSGRAVHLGDGTLDGFEMIVEDVTERRQLETQFRQAQKMEAVGQLAGGVAHDFGNLITAIMGYSDLLLRSLTSDDPRRQDALEIKETAARAGALTRQLLAYSRRQVLTPMVLDLNAVVAEMATMLRRLIGEDIQLVTVSRTTLGRIKADRGQLEQVVMNLAVNARDAMPGGGKLTIETANVELDARDARHLPGVRPGPAVLLAVGDTGTGMEPEVRAHLFEPFFTTKGAGKGTGLGLATVYGIVKQSGGAIAVDTAPGQGTTFRIYFPRVEDAVSGVADAEIDIERCRGTETILIVEDEAIVRAPARAYLQSLGYTVLEAANGADALRLAEDGAAIDLMVSDIVMPGMAGPELARRFRALRPDTPILLTSGYSDQSLRSGAPLPPDTGFLQKPFTPEGLIRRIRHLLDAA